MVKRRRAEVKVSTLSVEQGRELVQAEDKEFNTFVKYSVVEAASRQGISPSALMNMRWVVAFKDDGQEVEGTVGGARLHEPKHWQDSNIFSNRIALIASVFLTRDASFGFQSHKDVKSAYLQGDLDDQHVVDINDEDFKIGSAPPVSDTLSEQVPELSRKLQLEHHQCVRWLKSERSKKMVSLCCHRSSKHGRRSISHGILLVDFSETKMMSFRPCAWG